MKQCPSCQNQYSDDTLSFCLQDGTPLVSHGAQSTIDTIAFGDRTTIGNFVRPHNYLADSSRESGIPASYSANPGVGEVPKKSRGGLLAIGVVLTALVVSVTGVVGGWLYFSQQKQAAEKETDHSAVPDRNHEEKIHDSRPVVSEPSKTENVTPTVKVDAEAVRREIVDFVGRWKETVEAHKAAEYAAMYGGKVEYLGKVGVTNSDLKNEIQKTFDAYSEIEIEITNLLVAVDAEGTSATALFDKEWSYEANPKLNDGKTHTKLHLLKVGGEWKIVAEKNLKVYFNET